MLILAPIACYSVSHRLFERVTVRQARLTFIADATVEVLVAFGISPEVRHARWKQVVDQLGDRAVNALHHGWEVFAAAKITERMVMVVQQRRDPRNETKLLRVILEAVPEYIFGSFRGESGKRSRQRAVMKYT
jgi:hypothetical protein